MSLALLLVLAAVVRSATPTPTMTTAPHPGVDDAMRRAVFLEALQVVAKHRPAQENPPAVYCLSIENGADPSAELLERLAKDAGQPVHGFAECRRRDLVESVASDTPPTNVIALGDVEDVNATGARIEIYLLNSHSQIELTMKDGKWKGTCDIAGLGAGGVLGGIVGGLPAPPAFRWPSVPTPGPGVDDVLRHAVFASALRLVVHAPKDENPSGDYCLSVELGADPPPGMLERLAGEWGLTLYPASECVRSQRFYPPLGHLGGRTNVVAIPAIRRTGPSHAIAEIRVLGGSGRIVLTLKNGVWKGECCDGGLVG